MNKHFCCGSYEQHGKDLGSLVDQKQAAYGDIIAALSLARQQGWNIGGAVMAKAEFNKTR